MQDSLIQQMKKGVLEMLVLKLLENEDKYGYQLLNDLHEKADVFVNLKEGTLYPILYRLEKNGFVESYSTNSDGRKKIFYSATEEGSQRLIVSYDFWLKMKEVVAAVMDERSC